MVAFRNNSTSRIGPSSARSIFPLPVALFCLPTEYPVGHGSTLDASMSLLQLGMRRLGLQVPRSVFICRQCLVGRQQQQLQKLQQAPSRMAALARSYATASTTPPSTTPLGKLASEAGAAAGAAGARAPPSTRRAFPEHSTKAVAYWLLASAASVFGIVVFGGLTRLTESG